MISKKTSAPPDIENLNARVGLTILIYTGMRSGELCGLHWKDVNLNKGTIYVRYTFYRAEGRDKLSTPKTKSSERVIVIPSELRKILIEHKAWQEKRIEKLGSRWKNR